MWGDREKYRSYSEKQYNQALDMYFKESISVREIAKRLKMPKGTVSSWVYPIKNASLTRDAKKFR